MTTDKKRITTSKDYPFKVVLAGHNVDLDYLDVIGVDTDALTPETFTAAYARISRFPQPVDELRITATAEVEAARKSSEKLVHGLGHTNPAEHAVFNLDFIDVSRFVVEYLEDFLYPDYTEKAQRYIKMDAGGYVVPKELESDPTLKYFFEHHCCELFAFYRENFPKVKETLLEMDFNKKDAAGKAKEDTRYILPLATTAQFGSTYNGRSLEVFLNQYLVSDNNELREIAEGLFCMLNQKAPGLFKEKYIGAHPFYEKTRTEVKEYVDSLIEKYNFDNLDKIPGHDKKVQLHLGLEVDERVLSSLIFSSSLLSFTDANLLYQEMNEKEKIELDKIANKYRGPWHAPLVEYGTQSELAEIVISASAFAQLKRHRQARIVKQDYNPGLGITIPDNLGMADVASEFIDECINSSRLYDEISEEYPHAAPYILTNAHRRRILMSPDIANAIWPICVVMMHMHNGMFEELHTTILMK